MHRLNNLPLIDYGTPFLKMSSPPGVYNEQYGMARVVWMCYLHYINNKQYLKKNQNLQQNIED